jgi:hypothetical protein
MAMILRADLRENAASVCGSEEASGGDGSSLALAGESGGKRGRGFT